MAVVIPGGLITSMALNSWQAREIREMKLLLADIQRNRPGGATTLPARPAVVTPDMEPKIQEAVR